MGVASQSVPGGGGRAGPAARGRGGGRERACDGEAPHLRGDGESREREREGEEQRGCRVGNRMARRQKPLFNPNPAGCGDSAPGFSRRRLAIMFTLIFLLLSFCQIQGCFCFY
jgi:hypothetical protein